MQRFYGGDPMGWLAMPIEVLASYANNLDRTLAREQITDVYVARVAHSGALKKEAAKRAVRELQKRADVADRRPANVSRLRAAGIKVERR